MDRSAASLPNWAPVELVGSYMSAVSGWQQQYIEHTTLDRPSGTATDEEPHAAEQPKVDEQPPVVPPSTSSSSSAAAHPSGPSASSSSSAAPPVPASGPEPAALPEEEKRKNVADTDISMQSLRT